MDGSQRKGQFRLFVRMNFAGGIVVEEHFCSMQVRHVRFWNFVLAQVEITEFKIAMVAVGCVSEMSLPRETVGNPFRNVQQFVVRFQVQFHL